jgi:hypothetical protein
MCDNILDDRTHSGGVAEQLRVGVQTFDSLQSNPIYMNKFVVVENERILGIFDDYDSMLMNYPLNATRFAVHGQVGVWCSGKGTNSAVDELTIAVFKFS